MREIKRIFNFNQITSTLTKYDYRKQLMQAIIYITKYTKNDTVTNFYSILKANYFLFYLVSPRRQYAGLGYVI